MSAISKQSYIEDYFDIEAEIHIRLSKFCTSISKFVLRYRRLITKLSLILSGLAHAGLLKAIAGCSSVVYSHGSVFNGNSELDAGHQIIGHLRGGDSRRGPGGACRWGCWRGGGGALRRALAHCGSGVGPGRRCDHQLQAKS